MDEEQKTAAKFMLDELEGCIDPNDFQLEFFESLHDFFRQHRRLSEKQFSSLEKMYERVTG